MAGNSNLSRANKEKNDEFYTRLADIENELRHYREHFKGKTVFCNCDDPFESNFFMFFVLNFNQLGLKKLISTCYTNSPIANQQLSLFDIIEAKKTNTPITESYKVTTPSDKAYMAEITKVYDTTGDGGIDMLDVKELFRLGENKITELKGDGDFRSKECIDLLKKADIVVTNPPFSLFREYVATLMEYDKQFLIIGNQNAITYKEIFPLLKENKIWLGNNNPAPKFFYVPRDSEERKNISKDEKGNLIASFGNICWFTNLDIKKRHEDIILVKKYKGHEEDYPKYDNYNAIEVSMVKDIPYDYDGVMGVPITFLDKYNPDQFEIICIACGNSWANYAETLKALKFNSNIKYGGGLGSGIINGKAKYARLLIRNKHPEI